MRTRRLLAPLSVVVGLLAWAEWLHWRASTRRLGVPRQYVGREAVVVLGFTNRGRRANYVNRYRVRAGLRSISRDADESVLILCGGTVGSDVPEADLLLAYARSRGYTGEARLDRDSISTWQNIENAVKLLDGFDTIRIASNSLHAEKARGYLWKQRPDLGRKLARAEEYRLGEIALLKPVAALVGLRKLRRVG